MKNLYLKSIEHRSYHVKHACITHEVVDGNKILIELNPHIPRYVYNQNADLDLVVLAPRYVGVTLTPDISELPCTVNICLPLPDGNWKTGPWRLLDIGELSYE